MTRSLSIHPLSALLGLVFGGIILLSMSQTPPLNARNVNVQYLPDPRDMVQVREGTPYTVPSGKILVVTALGSTLPYTNALCFNSCPSGFPDIALLSVNGQSEVSTFAVPVVNFSGGTANVGDITSIKSLPNGFSVQAGSIVTVGGTGSARAWGFLAPQ